MNDSFLNFVQDQFSPLGLITIRKMFGGAGIYANGTMFGLISDDLKHNSLQLYFSRPIKKKDYVLGKASVIAFFLLILTMVPGMVFLILKIIFSGSFQFLAKYPWLPLSVIGYSLFLTTFFTFLVLSISSINKNRRYVAILIFGLYIFSDILFGIFYGIFHSRYFSLLSIKVNLQQVGAVFFGQTPKYDIPWIFSFLILSAVCVLASIVLNRRIKGVEVVK